MTPADRGLQLPERESAPVVEDPAVVAGKEAEAAHAAWLAVPHSTVDDEATQEFQDAEQAWLKAGRDFADAPITSTAGMFVKLRALVNELIEDVPAAETDPSWEYRYAKTILAFLEGFAGAAQAEPLVDLWTERNRLVALCCAADVDSELGQLSNELSAIEGRIAKAKAKTLAGVVVQIRLYDDIIGHETWVHSADISRNVVKALERLAGASVAELPEPDPVVVLSAEFGAIKDEQVAFDKTSDALTEDAHAQDQRHDLYERQHAIENRIIKTDATSVRGLAAKLRLMAYFQYSMPGLEERHATPAKDIDLKAMIEAWRPAGFDNNDALLVGALLDAERLMGVAAAPDPVVALFAEWGKINEEVIAFLAAIPEGAGKNMGKTGHVPGKPGVAPEEREWDDALDRRDAVEKKILQTPATSMRGVAVKIRLVTHCTDMTDLTKLYATPAREIDYEKECIVLECDTKAAISALLDAERLAGVS